MKTILIVYTISKFNTPKANGTDLFRAVYALFCGFVFAFSAAISPFIFLISLASFCSHSASAWAEMFLEIRFPSAPLGEYLPSQRWSFIFAMQPVPGFLYLPFVGSNLACAGFSCSVGVTTLPHFFVSQTCCDCCLVLC